MPMKPMKPCRQPGCPELIPSGEKYCEKHKALHPEDVRSAEARGYGSAWQRESKKFLLMHPLCEACLRSGRVTPSAVVDHKIPHRGDKKLFWDRSNWQALCKRCHDHKTRTEDETPSYHY